MNKSCVIFDLDGTLVDSERLCSQGYLDLLPQITDPLEVFYRRYRGWQMRALQASLEERLGLSLGDGFEDRYRARVAELFERELLAVEGAAQMLDALSVPKCVASNGPLKKMRHSLGLTGLAHHFEGRMFSAYDVGSWKPDPGLFLHAARAMDALPQHCIVVEDSEVGVVAGVAAGMQVLQYLPEAEGAPYAGATPFADLALLPQLIADRLKP